jgi:hypothetical protein
MFAELVTLERQFAAAALEANEADEVRVYPWRPTNFPELPAIWNGIDDASYEIVDTARADDRIVVNVTIAVRPSDLAEDIDELVRLTDVFRQVTSPALNTRPILAGTAIEAKRVVTRTVWHQWGGDSGPLAVCMEILHSIRLRQSIVA